MYMVQISRFFPQQNYQPFPNLTLKTKKKHEKKNPSKFRQLQGAAGGARHGFSSSRLKRPEKCPKFLFFFPRDMAWGVKKKRLYMFGNVKQKISETLSFSRV